MDPHDEQRLAEKYALLLGRLDARQARLVLGAEANAFTAQGQDGIAIVARAANTDPAIVAAGAAELDQLNSPSN